MSRAAYDRQRAAYIKSHSRKERIRLAWIMAAFVAGCIEEKNHREASTWHWSFVFSTRELQEQGYDMEQATAFGESVKAGLTSPVLHAYALSADYAFYCLLAYVDEEGELDRAGFLEEIERSDLPKNQRGMLLRAAFREAEHALISLPRTTRTTH